MRISKVILTRGDKTVILQGMIHIGPAKLYQRIIDEMREAMKNNYLVFYEGINSRMGSYVENEIKIIKSFRLFWRFYDIFAKIVGWINDPIIYPNSMLCADITILKMAQLLNHVLNEEDINLWSVLSEKIFLDNNIKDKLKEYFFRNGALKTHTDTFFTGKCLGDEFKAWRIIDKKMRPIIRGYRDALVASRIKDCDNNVIVHYGQLHIKGIIELLKKDGWGVKERRWLYLDQFV